MPYEKPKHFSLLLKEQVLIRSYDTILIVLLCFTARSSKHFSHSITTFFATSDLGNYITTIITMILRNCNPFQDAMGKGRQQRNRDYNGRKFPYSNSESDMHKQIVQEGGTFLGWGNIPSQIAYLPIKVGFSVGPNLLPITTDRSLSRFPTTPDTKTFSIIPSSLMSTSSLLFSKL